MSNEYPLKMCYHIDVPDVKEDGLTALFNFRIKEIMGDEGPVVDSNVEIWMPVEVLESLMAATPKLVADMKTMRSNHEQGKQRLM